MNLADVERMVEGGESASVEFKGSTGQLTRAAGTLYLFLNGEGGTILPSVTESGGLLGREVSDKTCRENAAVWTGPGTQSGPSRDQVGALDAAKESRALQEIMELCGRTDPTRSREKVIRPLRESGQLDDGPGESAALQIEVSDGPSECRSTPTSLRGIARLQVQAECILGQTRQPLHP